MEKIVFKNMYGNIVVGGLLIIAAVLGYFLGWLEDYLPLFVGIILFLLSTKRFIFSFKKIKGKNAILVLVIEYVLDLALVALLIAFENHVNVFIGLIIYIRGFSYLLINYMNTRKIKLLQYVINIGYLTLGAFLMFSSLDLEQALIGGIILLLLFVGAIFLQNGLKELTNKEKQEEELEKEVKEKQKAENKALKDKQKAELKGLEHNLKDKEKIQKLEEQIKEVKEEKQLVVKEKKDLEKQSNLVRKSDVKPNPLESKTVAELKLLAKEKGITGTSTLNKTELIKKIDEKEKPTSDIQI